MVPITISITMHVMRIPISIYYNKWLLEGTTALAASGSQLRKQPHALPKTDSHPDETIDTVWGYNTACIKYTGKTALRLL